MRDLKDILYFAFDEVEIEHIAHDFLFPLPLVAFAEEQPFSN